MKHLSKDRSSAFPSRIAVTEYLPVIHTAIATIESELASGLDLNRISNLTHLSAPGQFESWQTAHALNVLKAWLRGSKFTADNYGLSKLDSKAKWGEMLEIFRTKLAEYSNQAVIFEIVFSHTGRMTRDIMGTILSHDFESDGSRTEMLIRLVESGKGYVPTKTIRRLLDSKSEDAIRKMIKVINLTVGHKLRLPPDYNLIESKRRSGYRINPIYHIVVMD